MRRLFWVRGPCLRRRTRCREDYLRLADSLPPRLADFLADFFAPRLADFLADFFADFFADLRAPPRFAADFFAPFRAVDLRAPVFRVDFFADFLAAERFFGAAFLGAGAEAVGVIIDIMSAISFLLSELLLTVLTASSQATLSFSFFVQPLDKPIATCCLNSRHILLNCKNSPAIPDAAHAVVAISHRSSNVFRHAIFAVVVVARTSRR